MKARYIILLIVVLLPAAGIWSCVSGPPPAFDEAKWRKTVNSEKAADLYAPHQKDGIFFNPWNPMETDRFGELLKWKFSAKQPYTEKEKTFLPETVPDLIDRIEASPGRDFIAWIGHATFLMRIDGEYWLTDPIFSDRAFLPKRLTPPAIQAADLKKLTGRINVIISHNHYDHLDEASLEALPEGTRFFVPLGLKALAESMHSGEVREMDWWETIDLGDGRKLTCLPAQHWSRRIGQDTNASLWASFMLETPRTSIYYAGDSGYFIGYREIGRKFPGIDYALMPITAYHPRWFMHYNHMNVAEALEAFRELGAKYFIPTQWGTFHLGDDPPGYAALDLEEKIKAEKLDPGRFIVLNLGQMEMIK